MTQSQTIGTILPSSGQIAQIKTNCAMSKVIAGRRGLIMLLHRAGFHVVTFSVQGAFFPGRPGGENFEDCDGITSSSTSALPVQIPPASSTRMRGGQKPDSIEPARGAPRVRRVDPK